MSEPTRDERILGCVLGQLVADAAARPLHWVYDQKKLAALLEEVDEPAFFPRNASPFYDVPLGAQSGYGDQGLVMLRALRAAGGSFAPADFLAHATRHFGPGSAYAEAHARRGKNYDSPADRKGWKGAVPGPWVHATTLAYLERARQGLEPTGMVDGDESDAYCAALPVIALLREPAAIDQALRAVSSSELCMEYGRKQAAWVLAALGERPEPALPAAVAEALDEEHSAFVARTGKACPYPGTYLSALHAIATSGSFREAVEKTIVAGGCNCSRANFVGAVWGARGGLGGIPAAWLEKTTAAAEARAAVEELLAG